MGNLSEIVEVTKVEAFQQILDEWAALDLPVDASWEEGSFPAMVAAVGAIIRSAGSREAVALKSCTIGELLEGDALDLWSKSVYGHTRNKAETAVWLVRVSCSSGAGPYSITEGSMVATDGTLTFRVTSNAALFPSVAAYTLPANLPSSGYVDLAFYCETSGTAGGAIIAGAINRLLTTFAGVTVQSVTKLTGGADKETDTELKQRNSTWWATRNKLTLVRDAYIYYARSAHPEVKRVALDATNPRGAFTLDVYLAGDSGPVGSVVTAAVLADLQGRLSPEIAARLEVKDVTTYNLSVTGQIYYYSQFDVSAVQSAIISAVNELVKSLPIQGRPFGGFGPNRVLRSQFEKAIGNATINGEKCIDLVNLTGPAESTALSIGQVATCIITSLSFSLGSIGLYAVQQ